MRKEFHKTCLLKRVRKAIKREKPALTGAFCPIVGKNAPVRAG